MFETLDESESHLHMTVIRSLISKTLIRTCLSEILFKSPADVLPFVLFHCVLQHTKFVFFVLDNKKKVRWERRSSRGTKLKQITTWIQGVTKARLTSWVLTFNQINFTNVLLVQHVKPPPLPYFHQYINRS